MLTYIRDDKDVNNQKGKKRKIESSGLDVKFIAGEAGLIMPPIAMNILSWNL